MKKLLLAAIAILAILFAPLAYNEYSMIKKMGDIQKFVDSTSKPFKVFRPPSTSVEGITNYTNLQIAITNDGIVYYYGKSTYRPDLIESNSFIIIQHAYIENSSGGGFATEKNGQKYYFFTYNGLRTLVFSKNTSYSNPTEINFIAAGTLGAGIALTDEPAYSKAMISLAESMRQ